MSHPFERRLLKEYKQAKAEQLPGLTLEEESTITKYYYRVRVPNNKLYPSDEVYRLVISIGRGYPVDLPTVVFDRTVQILDDREIVPVVPMHPHIYSNGHICLNVLGTDWTPACGVNTVVLSVQSMLASNEVAERPPDDESYVKLAPSNPKKTLFYYHDDSV